MEYPNKMRYSKNARHDGVDNTAHVIQKYLSEDMMEYCRRDKGVCQHYQIKKMGTPALLNRKEECVIKSIPTLQSIMTGYLNTTNIRKGYHNTTNLMKGYINRASVIRYAITTEHKWDI